MGRLTKEEIQFIKNNPQLQCKEIAEILHHDRHTISKYKKQFGIAFTQTHNFSEYDQYIIDNYYKKTAKKIAEEIGCSKEYVNKIWMKNNLTGKPKVSYYCDYNFFETIDNEDKAYILGFIASDGNLYKRDKNHSGQIQITLNKKDKEILERILSVMKSNHPIKISTTKETATITFVSEKMYNDLLKIGLTENKTLDLHIQEIFKNIPVEYWSDFIRGYFDGDGSVYISNIPSKSSVSISLPEYSSKTFIEVLLKLTNISFTFCEDKRTEKYTIPFGSIFAKNATEKYVLLKLLYYKKPNLYLDRKKRLAEQFFKQIEENKTNRSENKIAVIKWGELLERLKW